LAPSELQLLKFTRIRSIATPEGEPPWIIVEGPEVFGVAGRLDGGGTTMAVFSGDIALALDLVDYPR